MDKLAKGQMDRKTKIVYPLTYFVCQGIMTQDCFGKEKKSFLILQKCTELMKIIIFFYSER